MTIAPLQTAVAMCGEQRIRWSLMFSLLGGFIFLSSTSDAKEQTLANTPAMVHFFYLPFSSHKTPNFPSLGMELLESFCL
jgi:hypothetical protein